MSGLYQAISDHLKSAATSAFDVRPATSAAEAEHEALGAIPRLLVIPAAERWDRVREAGLHVSQGGAISFSVVVALSYPGGFAEFETLRGELKAALCGWTPPDPGPAGDRPAGPVEHSGARLLSYSAEAGGRWLHSFDFLFPAQRSYAHQS